MLDLRPNSSTNSFRVRRFRMLNAAIEGVVEKNGRCRILDLGGTPTYWATFGNELDWNKVRVTLINLEPQVTTNPSVDARVGDARDVREFADRAFDIVFSNSVIEHVGRWSDMEMMAREVRRLAPTYFVQTPYFWFPIEPHARFPFLHWMPESLRYRIVMKRACGFWHKQPDVGAATQRVQSPMLLDKQQMQYLFPDATILAETFLGLTKSLTAVHDAP